jgi:hypothetical protein
MKAKFGKFFGQWWVAALIVVACMIVIVFWCTWNASLPYPETIKNAEQRGQFGDSFGVVNALVSGLGFIGLLFTLAIQQSQISQQSAELRRQAEKDQESRERDELDRYEQLLFRLLAFYSTSVDSIRITRNGREYVSRGALAYYLEKMQRELRSRNLHFLPEAIMGPARAGKNSDQHKMLIDYVALENCRVIQYTVVYQRRVMASLLALLRHLEERCPKHADRDAYRAVVSAQITHVETQYIFAMVLIYANESELRELLECSGLFGRDSPPYNFKFHQYLYSKMWGRNVGDSSKARKLACDSKDSKRLREAAVQPPLSDILKTLKIGAPVRPESLTNNRSKLKSHPTGVQELDSTGDISHAADLS